MLSSLLQRAPNLTSRFRKRGGNMPFDLKNPMGSMKTATETIANLGMEQSQKALVQINLLLKLLQSAGYGIASLDVELTLPPKITVKLETGPAVKEEKLSEILREHADQGAITAVIASLIQANRLRSSVTVETLELEGLELILATTPNITLRWKDKDKNKKAAAA
jgi:hypothetical protein